MTLPPRLAPLAAALLLIGCGEDEQSLVSASDPVSTPVTWAQVRPVIENHCARCHATFLDEAEAVRTSGEMAAVLEQNPMHGVGTVDPMTSTEWNTLMTWAKGNRK